MTLFTFPSPFRTGHKPLVQYFMAFIERERWRSVLFPHSNFCCCTVRSGKVAVVVYVEGSLYFSNLPRRISSTSQRERTHCCSCCGMSSCRRWRRVSWTCSRMTQFYPRRRSYTNVTRLRPLCILCRRLLYCLQWGEQLKMALCLATHFIQVKRA